MKQITQDRLDYYIAAFNEQLTYGELKDLPPGEQIVQCLDSESFGGKFYAPTWACTNMGRVWSIQFGRWLTPYADRGRTQNWKYKLDRTVNSRDLIANYWVDKTVVEQYGESHVEVRYKSNMGLIPPNLRLGTDDNRDARIADVMNRDNAGNLRYVRKIEN